MSTALERIAEQSARDPDLVFTTLAHHMTVEFLGVAFSRVRPDAAPGVDGVTWNAYAANLSPNLEDLHLRLREGRYRAPPVRRTWIDKEDGARRPLGIPTLEDNVVQRAVGMLLEAVYEPLFHEFSYGFRPGLSYDHRIRLDSGVTRSLRSRHATVAAATKADLRRHAALSARVTAALGTIQPSSVVIGG